MAVLILRKQDVSVRLKLMLQLSHGGCHSLQPSAARVGDVYPEISVCDGAALLLYGRSTMHVPLGGLWETGYCLRLPTKHCDHL